MQKIRISYMLLALFFSISITSRSAVVYYDIADQASPASGEVVYLDFDALSAETAVTRGGSKPSGFNTNFQLTGIERFTVVNSDSWQIYKAPNGFAARYDAGSELTGSNPSTFLHVTSDGSASDWENLNGSTKYYLGFVNATLSKKAWVGVIYDDPNNSFTITDFAVGDISDNFAAGDTSAVVPEPAETALVTSILAGICVTLRQRKIRRGSAIETRKVS